VEIEVNIYTIRLPGKEEKEKKKKKKVNTPYIILVH
jgi:hypothetical protein